MRRRGRAPRLDLDRAAGCRAGAGPQARVPGPRHLPPDPGGQGRRAVLDLQAPHHDPRSGAHRRGSRDPGGRRQNHPPGRGAASVLARRAPESLERAARRDVRHRPEADASGSGRAVHRAPARQAQGQAGHHRMGPDQRSRVAAVGRADRARPVVRRAPIALARPEDPRSHHAIGSQRSRPVQGRDRRMASDVGILLTGVGKRYDIVSAFAKHATVVAVDPNPLAPAQYAAHHREAVPRIFDPGYVPALRALCDRYDVGAVIPLTDLDIEVLAEARAAGELPALVPDPEIARATFDKYEAHLLLERLGLPSPPTVLPGSPIESFPVMVKPRQGSGARSIHRADDEGAVSFFVDYIDEPTMVQKLMDGPELSIDCLSDTNGRCINAIPRTMIESRGGESIKGTVVRDADLVALARGEVEGLGVRGPCTVQVFRDKDIGLGITDVNTRFGGAFPAPMYAALPGRTYPELIVRMARGEEVTPHLGQFRDGMTFSRYYWQLELNEQLHPTGRDIIDPPGPPAPR